MNNNEELLQAKGVLESFINEMKELESYYENLISKGVEEGKNVKELETDWINKVSDLYDQYLIEHTNAFYRPLSYPVTYDLSRDSITNIEKEKNRVLIYYKQITGVVEKEFIFYLKKIEGKYKIEKLTYFDQFKNKWIKRYI